MARINIEDTLFRDRRYQTLMLKIGDPTLALGAFCEACIIAQEFFLNEDTGGLIPIASWHSRGIRNELIEAGLAEISGEFVRLRGSDEQFAWLKQRHDAGKKGGRPKATETGRLATASGSNPLSPTLPLSQKIQESPNGDSFPVVRKSASREASSRQTSSISQVSDLRSKFSEQRISTWVQLYCSDYVEREIIKAADYLLLNPKKNRKSDNGFAQFMGNWLDRGWGRYQAGQPSAFGDPKEPKSGELVDWIMEAEWVFQACRKFTSSQNAEARKWLGEWRWFYLTEIGGLKYVRELRQNSFELKRLADLIKANCNAIDSRQQNQQQLEGA